MKKTYLTPELCVSLVNGEDIMLGSDTDINIKDLFEEE